MAQKRALCYLLPVLVPDSSEVDTAKAKDAQKLMLYSDHHIQSLAAIQDSLTCPEISLLSKSTQLCSVKQGWTDLPFSSYQLLSCLSPPPPTQVWKPGSLAGPAHQDLIYCKVRPHECCGMVFVRQACAKGAA